MGLAYRKDNRILIRSDLNLRETMTTVAHECRHLAQSPHVDTTGWVANEEDARIYEAAFATSYLNIN